MPHTPNKKEDELRERFHNYGRAQHTSPMIVHDLLQIALEFFTLSRQEGREGMRKAVARMVKKADMAYMFPATEERFLEDLSALSPEE